jgi:hypothetical protein
MNEIWKTIPGEPFYEASTSGRIRSLDRVVSHSGNVGKRKIKGRILRPRIRKVRPTVLPYHDVVLCSNGRPHTETVHKLVALAFHGPRPPLHEAAHGDGDPSNNKPENVRWATIAKNKDDYKKHGRAGRDVSARKRGPDGRFIAEATHPA